jgi:hypothetical protein
MCTECPGWQFKKTVALRLGYLRSLHQPFGIGFDVDHRHQAAELQLRDELEQKRRRGLAFADQVIALGAGIEIEVAVRRIRSVHRMSVDLNGKCSNFAVPCRAAT